MVLGWIALLAVVLVLALIAHLLRVSFPVRLIGGIYLAFGPIAELFFRPSGLVLSNNYVPITFYQRISPLVVTGYFTACGAFAVLGACAVRVAFPRRGAQGRTRLVVNFPNQFLLVAIVLILGIIGGEGTYVLHSPAYLAANGSSALLKVSIALMPIAVIGCAGVAFTPGRRPGVRIIAIALLVIIELLFLSRASRSFALFASYLFAGGWLTGRWGRRATALGGTLAAVITLLLLNIPLVLRRGPQFGLLPALKYLVSDPSRFFGGDAGAPQNNALLGAPLSVYVGRFYPSIPIHTFWVDVNPLPSNLTDWAQVSPPLHILPYEPYSAVGELLNYGWPYLIGYSIVIGVVFELLYDIAGAARGKAAGLLRSAVTGLAAVTVVRSTQYQLRTESRFVYYTVVVVVVVVLLSHSLFAQPLLRRILGPDSGERPAADVPPPGAPKRSAPALGGRTPPARKGRIPVRSRPDLASTAGASRS